MGLAPGSVWLDARGAQSVAHAERGIARYVAEHARALVETAPDLVDAIGLDPALPPTPSLDPLMGSGLLRWQGKKRAADRPVPSLYHVMSPFEAPLELEDIWPAWVRESGCRLVVTLYDLIPIIMRDRYQADWGHWATAWVARLGLMRSAHQVLTISRQTADDAMERLGIPEERITVIDSGVSGRHSSLVGSPAEADSLLRRELPKVRPGFLLYVGGTDFRKNLEGTIRAYSLLPEDLRGPHQLVIAGTLAYLRRLNLKAFARRLGIAPGGMVLTGFVSDRQLAALYRSCELFIFPSLYEGAGLPVLEAMSCGAPVAASNRASIPELLGDTDATFDPSDAADMARCLRGILESPGRLDSLRERSRSRVRLHTWERVAERTIEGYERAQRFPVDHRPGKGLRPTARKRRRLAVVTPWPPQPSGAAAHSRRLVEELAAHAEVEVIVSGDTDGVGFDRSLEPRVAIRTDAQFEWMHDLRRYDRCLYVLGGSRLHLHAFEAMMRMPGVVLAHDVRLLGLYLALHRHRFLYDPHWLEDKLLGMYGDRMAASYLRRIPYDDPHAKQSVSMTREVQAHARQLLVHSHHQAELLRLERPRDAAPTEIVPHGIPSIPAPRGGAGEAEGPLVVAGGTDGLWPKLVEGFAGLAGSRPGSRLIVLGELSDESRASIGEMAARLGLADSIEAPGRLDEAEYWEAVRGADLGAQLRAGANGGSASSAVCDCLAARVPTIVSDAGWEGELPVPVVLPVPADCSSDALAERMASALADTGLREEVRSAQDTYAEENSFARVAGRYAEILSL